MTSDAPLVAYDANLFDRDGTARDHLIMAFLTSVRTGQVRLFAPSGVRAEMLHARAPAPIRALADDAPRLPPLRLTAAQQIDRIRVRAILRGDGRPGKHDADATHLSEAAEAGCSYFLTQDGKILRKRDLLARALPPTLRIATLAEFMASYDPHGETAGSQDA